MVHVPTVADKYRQGIGDTVSMCQANDELTAYYVNGFAYKPHYPVPAPYYNCYDSELGIFLTVRNRDGNDVVVVDGWPNKGARQVINMVRPEPKTVEGKAMKIVMYELGLIKPNYPMPAIVSCQWCGSSDNTCKYDGTGEWCLDMWFVLVKMQF